MSQQSIVYKITLTPLEHFFLGGENVFGTEGQQSERRRSYLVQSNVLPQQTTLLGLLRYQLLAQNNCLLHAGSSQTEVDAAIALVGASGFSANTAGQYGLIKSLSPLYLSDVSGTLWRPAPLDDLKVKDKKGEDQPLQFELDGGYPLIRNMNPKTGLSLHFGTDNQDTELKSLDAFFGTRSQVGITMKNRVKHAGLSEEERKEAYYYQTYRTNTASAYAESRDNKTARQTYSFVFYAKMDVQIAQHHLSSGLVYMGGENSAFDMQIEATNWSDISEATLPTTMYRFNHLHEAEQATIKRMVLLSDAYADWSLIRANSLFVVNDTVPFRYFISMLGQTKHFVDLKNNDPNSRAQSHAFTLMQRGSVIYTNDSTKLNAITNHLTAQTAFRQIGYNYFQII